MSKQFREYLETALAAVEEKAARFRTALEILDDYDVERLDPPPEGATSGKPDKPKSGTGGGKVSRKPPAGTRGKAGKKECSVEGCTSPANSRGLCRKHYQRELKAEKQKAAAKSNGSDPEPPAADPAPATKPSGRLPKNRVPCGHPHCDASVPFTGGIPDEPMYCSDFCRNNHARILAETAAN